MADEQLSEDRQIENTEDERDISRSIEDSLLGMFMLSGALFVTAWDFVFHPSRFARAFADKTLSSRYARPVTYFMVTSLLTLGAFELWFKLMREKGGGLLQVMSIEMQGEPFSELLGTGNPFERLFTEGISSLDLKKIILVGIPFLAAVGLYSYAITKSAARRSLDLSFEKSLSLSCYGAGSGLLMYLLMIPPSTSFFVGTMNGKTTDLLRNMPWWGYVISVFGWAWLVACIRSYLVLLRSALSVSSQTTLLAWGGGLWRFLLWYYLVLFWFFPMGIRLMQ